MENQAEYMSLGWPLILQLSLYHPCFGEFIEQGYYSLPSTHTLTKSFYSGLDIAGDIYVIIMTPEVYSYDRFIGLLKGLLNSKSLIKVKYVHCSCQIKICYNRLKVSYNIL